jgi:peptidoglycan hydrolase-like protein with peptidoglycan-binding domain
MCASLELGSQSVTPEPGQIAQVPATGLPVSSLPSLLAGVWRNTRVSRMHSRPGIIVGLISLLGLTGVADLRAAEDRPASFDCTKDRGQLAVTVCGDRTLTAAERRTTVNYLALYFSLGDESRTSFRNDHMQWLSGLTARCGPSPNLRPLGGDQPALSVDCVRRSYTQRGDLYHKRLSGTALEESNLSPTLLKKIQKRLAELKFLSGNVDGVFGADTRAAIRSYQASVGHPQGNFLTAQDRNMLLASNGPSAPKQTATTQQAPSTAQQTPITPQQTPVAAPQTPATAPESASERAPVQQSATADLQSADSRSREADTTKAEPPVQQNTAEAANSPANADSAAPADTGAGLQPQYFIAGAVLAVVILAFAAVFVFVRLRRRTQRATVDVDVAEAFDAPADLSAPSSVSVKTETLRPGASTTPAGVARDARRVDADAPLAPERVVELLPHLEKGAKT